MTDHKSCLTCQFTTQRDQGTAPLWDSIYRSQFWDVVHHNNTSLPGWLVLVARRHLEAIDELTSEEASELGTLLRKTSLALKEITGCIKTYVIQFAEATGHNHVHFHVVPRMADQPQDRRGIGIFGYVGIPETERVSESQMNEVAAKVRRIILDSLGET